MCTISKQPPPISEEKRIKFVLLYDKMDSLRLKKHDHISMAIELCNVEYFPVCTAVICHLKNTLTSI